MSNLIRFFGIVKNSGISLLELKYDDKYDEDLMGGFVSAIYRFGDESCSDELSKISLEGDNMRISSINHRYDDDISLMAVGILSQAIREEKFKSFTEQILNKFCQRYHNELIQFNGNKTKFTPFKKYLSEQINKQFGNDNLEFKQKLDNIFEQFQEGDLSGLDELDKTFNKFVAKT
jgi:hypothetical protein